MTSIQIIDMDDYQLEIRTIWFWQAGRFFRNGYDLGAELPTWRPASWAAALHDLIRPLAQRRVAS